MRRLTRLAAGIGFTFLFGVLGNAAYADEPEHKKGPVHVTEFSGHIVFCAPMTDPIDVEVLPGGVEIVTFQNIGNVWLTGNPLLDGTEVNIVRAKFDPASPVVKARLKGKIDVAALDGKWKYRQFLTFGPEGESGFGMGLGFGDLHGALMYFEAGAIEEIENSPCGVPAGAPVRGKIIRFGWTG